VKYGSGRTKTSHIANTLADDDSTRVAAIIRQKPFSLVTDGSNDIESVQLYPVCVRYFDPDIDRVLCVMLSLKECSESPQDRIFVMR